MLRITDFIWLESVIEKLEVKHGVDPGEVEEVFANREDLRLRKVKKGRIRQEHVYRALGRTHGGRYLVVFFIHKPPSQAFIVSAREMDAKERRGYAK